MSDFWEAKDGCLETFFETGIQVVSSRLKTGVICGGQHQHVNGGNTNPSEPEPHCWLRCIFLVLAITYPNSQNEQLPTRWRAGHTAVAEALLDKEHISTWVLQLN